MKETQAASFAERVCLPHLAGTQNADGGWGFHPGQESRVEATCWALQALICWSRSEDRVRTHKGFQFLNQTQLPDGSWPAMSGETSGSWVTSLAVQVLLASDQYRNQVVAGLTWLENDRPRDSFLWLRLLRKFSFQKEISPRNDALFGWGWTPGTSTWVEPTALTLLLLSRVPDELLTAHIRKRRTIAEALLYDRMCPGGGWNCGNPLVYGVEGTPLVVPTSWALLALRHRPENSKKSASLQWLQQQRGQVSGPASLALLYIVLAAYGIPRNESDQSLEQFHGRDQFLQNTLVIAWACLAEGPGLRWLTSPAGAAN